MTEDFAEVDVKIQQSLEGVDFTKGGELLLTHIGIELATPQLADVSPWEFAHYMAIENWLAEYQPKPDASNLEQVRGYLEAFHHLCELEAWETASKILVFHPNLAKTKELHEQLGTWGYYREQIELYSSLLYKLNQDLDCILLCSLGRSYHYLGKPHISINYYQQLLEISRNIYNSKAEAQALGGLGKIYAWCLNQEQTALQHYQQQLVIVCKIDDRQQEIEALDGLGDVYCQMGHYQKSIKYCKQALALAREINNQDIEMSISASLGSTYRMMGQPKKGLELFQRMLDFCYQTSNRRQEWVALQGIGTIYCVLSQYENAIEYLEKALKTIQEIGDYFGESVTLNTLASTYARSKQYETAISYFKSGLIITRQVGNRYLEGFTSSSLSYCYARLKQYKRAVRYSNLAIKISYEINNKQLQGAAIGTLAHAYWQQKSYLLSWLFIIKSMMVLPPWQNETSQFIFKTTIATIGQATKRILNRFLSYFKLKERDSET